MKPNRVSRFSAGVLLALSNICMGLFLIPTMSMNSMGRNAWIVPVLGLGFGVWGAWVIGALSARFPDKTLVGYSRTLLGKPLGVALSVACIAYWVADAALGLHMMTAVETYSLLPRTPGYILTVMMLAAVGLLAAYGIEVMTRVAIVACFFLVAPLLLFVLILPPLAVPMSFDHLRPFLPTGAANWLSEELYAGAFVCRGFTVLAAIAPSLSRPRDAVRVGLWAVCASFPLFLAVVVYPLLAFGWPTANYYLWPFWQLAVLVKTRAIPIERPIYAFESAVQTIVVITACTVVYAAAVLTRDLFGLKSTRSPLLVYLPLILVLALIPNDAIEFLEYATVWLFSGVFIWLVAPTVMLGLCLVRRIGAHPQGEG